MALQVILTCILLITSCIGLAFGDTYPCPFNPYECQCTSNDPTFDFDAVSCFSQTGSLVNFTTPKGISKPYVIGDFFIVGNVVELPPKYLTPFSSIARLQLFQSGPTSQKVAQNWNEFALDGVSIGKLVVNGLDEMFPPPTALLKLNYTLTSLSITNGQKPIKLVAYQFLGFSNLQSLDISDTPIAHIHENAFAGLENSLMYLQFQNTTCQTVELRPFVSFQRLQKLVKLSLIYTGITDFPASALSRLSNLVSFRFSSDYVASFDENAFLSLPVKLKSLTLSQIPLSKVPKLSFLPGQQEKLELILDKSQITAIRLGDFGGVAFEAISLVGNPITTIDQGVILSADTLYFGRTPLESLDLSAISNVTNAIFEPSPSLKRVSVSDYKQAFNTLTVKINPALNTIDSTVGGVFATHPQFKIDISSNPHLDCEQLVWMTPYVSWSKQVLIQNSICTNGQSAADFFNGGH